MYSSSMLLLRDIYFKVNFYIVPIILIVKKNPNINWGFYVQFEIQTRAKN